MAMPYQCYHMILARREGMAWRLTSAAAGEREGLAPNALNGPGLGKFDETTGSADAAGAKLHAWGWGQDFQS